MAKQLNFEDSYEVKGVDKDGNFFDKVSRIDMVGETYEVDLSLDVNVEIYRLRVGDKLQVLLASALDSEPDTGHYKPQRSSSLMDKFEYVVSGRVFKRNPTKDGKIAVVASFGGLLMRVEGDASTLKGLELDMHLYLLARKLV